LLHGANATLVQPFLHARADPWQIAWGQRGEGIVQHVRRQGHQAVRLFHIGRHFGQVAVGREANRTAKRGAGLAPDRGFDLARQFERGQQRLFPAQKAAGHLVNGHDRGHGEAGLNSLNYPMVVVHIEFMPGLHQHDAGAEPLGLANLGSGSHPIAFGLVTGSDTAGCIRHQRNHCHRAAAELRPQLLLHRGEVGIEVQEQPLQPGIPHPERIGWRVGHISLVLHVSDFLTRC
jgi:hypothetical protein